MKRSRPSDRHPEVRAQRASKGDDPPSFEARAPAGALAPQDDGPPKRQRIDKWLWHARMLRTRSAASALVEAGHVRLNGRRIVSPSQAVRAGDVVTLALDRSVRVVKVAGFCERRGAAPAARALYREMTTGSGAKASAAGADSAKVTAKMRAE